MGQGVIQNATRNSCAFTLVELSIVIVIIGLIVGGIVGGSSLLEQGKLKSVIQQMQQVQGAVLTFNDKYDAYPGDMANANSYWSAATGGDGDSTVELNNEAIRSWHHLALSGIYPGNFNGVLGASPTYFQPGINYPRVFDKGGIWLRYVSDHYSTGKYGNILFAGDPAKTTNRGDGSLFLPSQVRTMDVKIDDGMPRTGRAWAAIGFEAPATQCITGSATYNVSALETVCTFQLWINR